MYHQPSSAGNTLCICRILLRNELLLVTLLLLLLASCLARADSPALFPGLSVISEADIRDSTIAFVNTTTAPGLSGAVINVDADDRESDQWRSSLGFSAELTLRDHVFNGYWGLAAIGGQLEDSIALLDDSGAPVELTVSRQITGLRGSLGLSFPVSQYLKIRPYMSLTLAEIQSNSRITAGKLFAEGTFESTVTAVSAAGTIDAEYSRWFADNRLDLSAEFNLIYNDTESEDNPYIDVYAWDQTALIEARYSGPTDLVTDGRNWRWEVYASHVNFITQSKVSLGYTGLFEVGTGLEWSINIKPLDWFGWESVGFSVGVITSRNVEGYNIGLTAK